MQHSPSRRRLSLPRFARLKPGARLGMTLAAPALLLVGGVYFFPALLMAVYSLSSINKADFTIESFVGLRNYLTVLSSSGFLEVVGRTLYFAGGVALFTSLLAFPIALLLNYPFPGRGFVRVMVLLPWAIPPIVSGVMWGQIFHADFGMLNGILRLLGLPGDHIWLGDAGLALHALMMVETWRSLPLAVLFLLAALQTLPESIYEAAQIDGAGAVQSFRYLTLPLMLPLFLPILSFTFIVAMKAFDTIFVLTRGGPAMGTTTLNYLIYQQAFQQQRFGQAAAGAYLLCLLTVTVFVALSLLRRFVQLRSER
jgi:multiple sugar transport system permease protein